MGCFTKLVARIRRLVYYNVILHTLFEIPSRHFICGLFTLNFEESRENSTALFKNNYQKIPNSHGEKYENIFTNIFADGYQRIYKGNCTVMQLHFIKLHACMQNDLK